MPPMDQYTLTSKPTEKSSNTASSKELNKLKPKKNKKTKKAKRKTSKTLPSGKPPNPMNPNGPLLGVKADPAGTLSALPWLSQFLARKWTSTLEVLT